MGGVTLNKLRPLIPRVMCERERLCEFVYVCVRVLCVFEVRGGVAVCAAAVERFELQQGEGVCEPSASSCSLNLPLFLFFLFLLYLPPFPSLFSLFFSRFHSHIHRLTQCASSPSIFSLSLVEQGRLASAHKPPAAADC